MSLKVMFVRSEIDDLGSNLYITISPAVSECTRHEEEEEEDKYVYGLHVFLLWISRPSGDRTKHSKIVLHSQFGN